MEQEDLFRVGLEFGAVDPIMTTEDPVQEPIEDKTGKEDKDSPEIITQPPAPKGDEKLTFVDNEFYVDYRDADPQAEPDKKPSKPVESEALDKSKPELEPEPKPGTEPVEDSGEEEISPSMLVYNFLRENQFAPEVENFDGSPESLRNILESLPDTYMQQALGTIHDDSRVLLQYAYNLGKDADIGALKTFFDQYYEPQLTDYDITTDEGARGYLADMFRRKNVYDSAEDINNALDMLADQDKIKTLAQKNYTVEKQEFDKKAAEQAKQVEQQAKLNKEKQAQRQQAIIQQLNELEWSDDRKMKIAQNLNPNVASQKTKAIMNSPKAVVQMADFYTYFDEKKGEFNLDAMVKARAESLNNEDIKKNIEKDSFTSSLGKIKPGQVRRKTKQEGKVIMPSVDLTDESTASKIF